jgi:hypothetical protein
MALMLLGSQSEETLLCIHEQSLSHGASQSAVRRCCPSLCFGPHESHPNSHTVSSFTWVLLLSKLYPGGESGLCI